jgi:hypothetical protein
MSGAAPNLIHTEQTKLTATAVSNVGAAFVIAGFVAPLVSGQLSIGKALLSVLWIGIGVWVHMLGRRALEGLQ